ncbi:MULTISPECIES: hypothetical protein [Candidatus Brocadia]|uniref:Uncharacterized protein n=1 Tax=Candidatus Brocadia sinica JPN1 TaxID=1197129 RepID=A0ABQ0JYC9_9BACT|nr:MULTISPECIES: hypothetical protein [Brocadia]NOG40481.1 hypothetical protein [Planctomycetota bacterium]GAN33716.1 hypothetical protein BROSI_A2250 [Candidatus Brocadia sinica JPN1]GIK13543.1 MAG: hypothetical protein BroJett002_22500 [Candidatus Brocadia sinica]GJQ17272.1 MAG: hypothetical protein HBSIN01_12310 [Candidatus Brocadia sinica]
MAELKLTQTPTGNELGLLDMADASMTPATAIRLECKWCSGVKRRNLIPSEAYQIPLP